MINERSAADEAGQDIGLIAATRAVTGSGGGAWLLLALVLLGPSLSAFQSTVVSPLVATLAEHFGGGDRGAMVAQLGLTIPAIGVMIGGPLTANLIVRFGYRAVIVASAIVLAGAGGAGAIIDEPTIFLLSRFVVGFASVALYSAFVALSGVLFAGKTLSRMISYQHGINALAALMLVLVSGWTAKRFGWQASFLIYLPVLLFAAFALMAWLPANIASIEKKTGPRVSLRPIMPLLLITIGVFAAVFIVIVQGSLLLTANGIDDLSVQSMVIAASTLTYAATAAGCSWIQTHVTGRFTFTASLALLAAGVLLMGIAPSLGGAMAGSLLIGAGSGISASYLTTAVVQRAPEGARERAVGLIAPAHYVGQFANPFIMQSLSMAMGIQSAFMVAGLVLGAAMVAAALHQTRIAQGGLRGVA